MPIKKILVVDDSPTETRPLGTGPRIGYQVVTAESGDEAVDQEQVRIARPDPDGRGHAGHQRLPGHPHHRPRRGHPHIPVIICTSKGQETDKIWGMRQGAFDYMVKPLDHAVLLEKIRAFG
jgi:twitching motility two-component system response regulator PilH